MYINYLFIINKDTPTKDRSQFYFNIIKFNKLKAKIIEIQGITRLINIWSGFQNTT